MTHRYEIRGEMNGNDISRFVIATTPEKAIEKFHQDWEESGDTFTGSCWVAASWKIQH